MFKILITILTLTASTNQSHAYGTLGPDWKKVSVNNLGDTFYVDFDRIIKVDGYVLFWTLLDYVKPNKDEVLSYKTHNQGDCSLFRLKPLRYSFHKQSIGRGAGMASVPKGDEADWDYPHPKSSSETILKQICGR